MNSIRSTSVEKIRIAKAEIVVAEGEKPKLLALNELIEEKRKSNILVRFSH